MLLIIRCLLLIIMVVFSFYPARAAKNEGKIRLEVFPDRADCLYQLGDTAVFSVNIANPGRTSRPFLLRYAFSEDKARRLEQGELQTTGGSIKLAHGMERPGFLRLDLLLIAGADTLRQASACGFDPQAVRPTNILPPDFQRFWRQGQAELLRIPIDATLRRVTENEVAGAKRYLVSLACIEGSRMFGWLTVPEGRGPFPAVVHIMGAPGGIHEYRTDPGSGYARAGMIILALNIHGIELGLDQEVYEQYQARNLLGGFPFSGCDDPYRYYYRRVVLGGIRAMDYLCSREDADTTRLAVAGDS
ncbi:MAG TPA: acetylxylan esterase, partial [archaeon]|nr:acetylxylan esterase [archaeon]